MTYPWPYSLPPHIHPQPQPTQPHWIQFPPQASPQPFPTLPPTPPQHPTSHHYPLPITPPPHAQYIQRSPLPRRRSSATQSVASSQAQSKPADRQASRSPAITQDKAHTSIQNITTAATAKHTPEPPRRTSSITLKPNLHSLPNTPQNRHLHHHHQHQYLRFQSNVDLTTYLLQHSNHPLIQHNWMSSNGSTATHKHLMSKMNPCSPT